MACSVEVRARLKTEEKSNAINASGETSWYPTDNAGKIFASLNSWQLQSTFRVSAGLKQHVQIERLESALERTVRRFPLFQTRVKPGFFWYYFEPNGATPPIQPDSKFPLGEAFSGKGRGHPWRIRVYHRTVALDCAHVLTDGSGALTFLNTLLAEYLNYQGPRDPAVGLLDVEERPHPEELENAFPKQFQSGLPAFKHESRACQLSLDADKPGVRHVTCGRVSASLLREKAKVAGASVGEYLNAAYLEALQGSVLEKTNGALHKVSGPIRIDVPVNLRPVFPSRSLRNFFLTVFVAIDPRLGEWSFEEILEAVHHQMRLQRSPRLYRQIISRNVGSERSFFLRHLPLAVKNMLMPWIFQKWNLRWTTSSLSNLGMLKLPVEMADGIERFDMLPTHPASRSIGCGVIGFGDKISITFNRTAIEPIVERLFFRGLRNKGIPVSIETNEG
ncbi:hypothetical protein [Rubellicoccus peritrichatus]|uniref:Alcohol acetyltransferase n=1 Tax=Rubellicoccus peritrichatus TaxID=3080537 RepID=A0AAQ3QWG8_9BACT|nr:hypothetical protein [Puniceicoccus sp. CR14]WOO42693.1 hypothetical protein RZN69_06280 [Puniceicoccus sp. CR14]